jgi:hypothetical protein
MREAVLHQRIFAQMRPAQTSLVLHKPGPTEAVRVSDGSSGRSVTADLSNDGILTLRLTAKRRQNEQGNDEVCRILSERLNKGGRDGSPWQTILDPKDLGKPEEGIDRILVGSRDARLNIQITRAGHDPSFWRLINRFTPTTREVNVDEYVAELKQAIEKKSNLSSRSEIVLALDAIETGHAFLSVTTRFTERHGPWARQVDFKAIWIVGPTAELTQRLDVESPPRGSPE